VLTASGLIAGEALTGLLIALFVLRDIKLPEIFKSPPVLLGFGALAILAIYMIQVPLRNAGQSGRAGAADGHHVRGSMKIAFRCLMACALAVASAVAQTDPRPLGRQGGCSQRSYGAGAGPGQERQGCLGRKSRRAGAEDYRAPGDRHRRGGRRGPLRGARSAGQSDFRAHSGDGKLTGALLVPALSLALEMQRTGDAKVEIAPPSPAVSKDLEGDWEGALSLPNGQTRRSSSMFKNQPDRTVEATIESPTQGVQGFPLKEVAQKGAVVEFAVQAVGGGYKGTLNKEGTEIAGEWTQRQGAAPLTLT